MPKGLAEYAIAGLRLILLAVVFASLWIRFVAMADDTRITDSGQATMGAFLVYILTLIGDAARSIWIMLFRRCLMICCIFVLTAITAVDNTLHLLNTEVESNTGSKVGLDWAILCAFIIVSVIELGMPSSNAPASPRMPVRLTYAENDKGDESETEEVRIV